MDNDKKVRKENQYDKRVYESVTNYMSIHHYKADDELINFWIKYFSVRAIITFHIALSTVVNNVAKYLKVHPQLSHDRMLNHGGSIVDGTLLQTPLAGCNDIPIEMLNEILLGK